MSSLEKGPQERRLAAIMFTDMVGYSALTQSDEAQALAVLERHNALMRSVLNKYNGREIKTVGDSFLVEFDSALVATQCALDIQECLHDYNLSSGDNWKIKIRIGIHLGDIVHRENDVFGDAVNIASRIEPLAEPEGIAISQQVFDQVHNKLDQELRRLDQVSLKNIKTPTSVYVLVPRWIRNYSVKQRTESAGAQPQTDKKRIAVLPLANLSSDPENEFFADGITEELISALSSLEGLTVIARTSIMRYKGTSKTAGEIGAELNVGSLLEGSVRKQGERIRVTAQLIDTSTQGHLWSASYDRELKDVFEVQTDVARQVASASRLKLLANVESRIERRGSASSEAYTCYLKGRYYLNERTVEGMKKARDYFARALEYDPEYTLACTGLADAYSLMTDWGIFPSEEGLPKARHYALKAVELDPSLAEAHTSLAAILYHDWNVRGTLRELETAVRINPNYALAHHWHAIALFHFGRAEEALNEIEKARDLDPYSAQLNTVVGMMYFRAGQIERALAELNNAIRLFPDFDNAHDVLAAVLCYCGRYAEAIAEAEKAVSLSGNNLAIKGNLAQIYAHSGRRPDAEKILHELQAGSKEQYISPLVFATVNASLGNMNAAMSWLEKAYENRVADLPHVADDRIFRDDMASDPRFDEFLKKTGVF